MGTAAQKKMLKRVLETSGMNPKMQSKVEQMIKCITRLGGEPSMAKFQVLAKKLVKIMGMDACDKFYGWLQQLEKCLFIELIITHDQYVSKWARKQKQAVSKIKPGEHF